MEKEIKDIPARKQREQSRLDEHKREVAQAELILKQKQAEIKKIEVECDSSREKIRKLRQQQFEIKTNKEFKALETEVGSAQAEISKCEDGELVMMQDVENARRELEAKRNALKQEESAILADVQAWQTRATQIEKELEELRLKRQTAATGIDPEWMSTYKRIIRRRDKALVQLEPGGVCGGCHMQLPPYVVHEARRLTTIVTCDYCGRMVY
jgi:hypothetical protein